MRIRNLIDQQEALHAAMLEHAWHLYDVVDAAQQVLTAARAQHIEIYQAGTFDVLLNLEQAVHIYQHWAQADE